jgi:hypothetical protein
MGGFFKSLFGGGGSKSSGGGGGGGGSSANKKLFTPEQVSQVTKDYGSQGLAKWNQIMAGMGAGGGTGDSLTQAIQSQADAMGKSLSGLTQSSGYGSDGMAQLEAILKGVEPGIGAKYPLY